MVNLPTCATQQGNPGGVLPGGYRVRDQFTHITTTATYTGPVTICLNYSDAGIGDEHNLKLFHWDGTSWKDVTTSVDPVTNIICGQDDSLS
jgi:hypothetical protein